MFDYPYTWVLPGSVDRAPLVVLQKASSGSWEDDPAAAPPSSLVFWVVSQGSLGPVLTTSSGTLVSEDLADVIRSACPQAGTLIPAVVAHPQNLAPPAGYFLVRPNRHLAHLMEPSSAPDYAYVLFGASRCVVFSQGLRDLIEASGMPNVVFSDPFDCIPIGSSPPNPGPQAEPDGAA
jgi:hypothetical protein